MFPESLALTNYPKQLQQTFDAKFQPPQAITIETLQPRGICSGPNNSVSQVDRSQQLPKTEFERKMFAMKRLAQKKIRELSRSEDENIAVERILGKSNLNSIDKGLECEREKAQIDFKPQGLAEAKVDKTNHTEIMRIKNILEGQLSELESILDTTKGRKQQNLAKKSTQIEDKELTSKINKIITSLLKEISSLERQIMHLQIGSKHSEVAQKLLSTYQFSMSFIQTYHNEYSSRISEKYQEIFKEKLSKLTKSLTSCASQLSEFPNFDFPMPDLPSKPQKSISRNPPLPQKKNKSTNHKKAALPPKGLSKNPKTYKPSVNAISDQNRCFVRRTNYNQNPENEHPNFSSDESLISFLASKPGHSRLTSPSNSRAHLEGIPSPLLSRHQTIASQPLQAPGSTLHGIIDDLSQEMIEELVDEQIADVLNSIDLAQIVSEVPSTSHFKPLPDVLEDLDYYLSAINSYENLLSSVEKNLKLAEESPEIRETETPKVPEEASSEEKSLIIIPNPEHSPEDRDEELYVESSICKKTVSRKRPIDPVSIQNLSDDRYKMLRYNRLHQPSIRLALKHNLLERMKDEILDSAMDSVSRQIFKTLDNYVEKNFFDEFLKTPETMDFVRNILRKTTDVQPTDAATATLGIQTDQRTKSVQIQSTMASPTPSHSPLPSQDYSSDFSSYSLGTERSASDTGVMSENSEISIRISEHSVEIPSQLISSAELSQPVLRSGHEMVYGVSITEQISEISIGIPGLSHESPLPANDRSSSDSQTPTGSSIYISRAVTQLKTVSRSDSTEDPEFPAAAVESVSSSEPNLSEIAYSTVLRRRSDIVCLDIESMLPLPDTTEHEVSPALTDSPSDPDQPNEYTDTFTESNSTLYSPSETQTRKQSAVPLPPLTPIFQDSLDSSRALTQSASSRSTSVVTECIEELSDS